MEPHPDKPKTGPAHLRTLIERKQKIRRIRRALARAQVQAALARRFKPLTLHLAPAPSVSPLTAKS